MSWWTDLLGGPVAAASGSAATVKTLAGIWTNLRDYKMWRSLGWLTLGIVLMLFGVALWARAPITAAAEGLA